MSNNVVLDMIIGGCLTSLTVSSMFILRELNDISRAIAHIASANAQTIIKTAVKR